MLETVVLLWKQWCILIESTFNRTAFIWNRNLINVFVTFNQFNASLLNKYVSKINLKKLYIGYNALKQDYTHPPLILLRVSIQVVVLVLLFWDSCTSFKRLLILSRCLFAPERGYLCYFPVCELSNIPNPLIIQNAVIYGEQKLWSITQFWCLCSP